MANVLIPCCDASAAATASLVERGFEAQSATSAPPALSVSIRLAVSLVTCRHAAILRPLRGCSLTNLSRIRFSTGISRAAQSIRPWPSVARFRSLTSFPFALTFKSVVFSSIDDLADDFDIGEALSAGQLLQLDQDLDADDLAAELANQANRGGRRAACRQYIIDDQHLLAGLDGVGVHLELVGSVLELVGVADRVPRKLPDLANGDEPRI